MDTELDNSSARHVWPMFLLNISASSLDLIYAFMCLHISSLALINEE